MFAPEPVSQLRRMDAKICFRDGSERTWEFFDPSGSGTLERWRKERHRKWAHENLRLDSNKRLWEPAARYIARQFSDDPNNPPILIEFRRHWADVPAAPGSVEPLDRIHWESYTFYRAELIPEGGR
jgi:hypothetical protein